MNSSDFKPFEEPTNEEQRRREEERRREEQRRAETPPSEVGDQSSIGFGEPAREGVAGATPPPGTTFGGAAYTGEDFDDASRADHKITESAREEASKTKSRMRERREEMAQKARQKGEAVYSDASSSAARTLDDLSEAVHHCAQELEEKKHDRTSRAIHATASQLEDVAGMLRQKNLEELTGDVERFARRRPEVFFGGMVAVGFALGRFVKSSGREDYEDYEPQELPYPPVQSQSDPSPSFPETQF